MTPLVRNAIEASVPSILMTMPFPNVGWVTESPGRSVSRAAVPTGISGCVWRAADFPYSLFSNPFFRSSVSRRFSGISLINREGAFICVEPKIMRVSADMSHAFCLARVSPTYINRRSSSSSAGESALRECGKIPSSSPTRKTKGNSRPLALCMVMSCTAFSLPSSASVSDTSAISSKKKVSAFSGGVSSYFFATEKSSRTFSSRAIPSSVPSSRALRYPTCSRSMGRNAEREPLSGSFSVCS